MTNIQLFFSIVGVMAAFHGLSYHFFIKYVDARFTSIDNQLKFLLEHSIDHSERIASLETHTKIHNQGL